MAFVLLHVFYFFVSTSKELVAVLKDVECKVLIIANGSF
jgi:hypothetical protein